MSGTYPTLRAMRDFRVLGAVLVGLALGALTGSAVAGRNSSGTMSLVSGNPVVTNTTISASWANNTLSDIATELTSSLDRSGRGAMLAALELVNGSVGTPAVSFDSDTDTGLYRIGANNPGLAAGGVKAQEWTATSSTIPVGLTITNSNANTAGLTCTGNGTAAGLVVTGGSTSGNGITATGGASNGKGVHGTGDGTGEGGYFTGGDTSATGVLATGGAPNGVGGSFTGTGTGKALYLVGGTAATGGTRRTAVEITNGDIDLDGVADPTSTTALKDKLTPLSFVKAWGQVATSGPTVTAGMNIASVSCASDALTVTFAQAMSSTAYAVTVSGALADQPRSVAAVTLGTGSFLIRDQSYPTSSLCSLGYVVHFLVLGPQ